VSGADFSGVDIDLLADYVGGALDGTPDETVVSALIAEDSEWRDAYARLTDGVAAVTEDLRTLASVAEPMPADVVARLDAALLASAGDRQSRTTAATEVMEPGTDGAAPARHLVAVPSGSRSKRARRLRWAAPAGIAAGVLAFVGFGLQQQFAGDGSEDSAATAGAGEAAPVAGREFSLPGGSVPLTESGRDYRQDTLAEVTAGNRAMAEPQLGQESTDRYRKAVPSSGEISMPDPALDRLRVQQALSACIEAISAQQGAGEVATQAVDFARFDGAPAVIVRFTAGGKSWVWASGPACGTAGVGADKLGAVQVG
jgi:hypothetical protein